MRTRLIAAASGLSARPLDRQPRLRSAVLLPAVVATAAAMQAPAALALSSDLRSHEAMPQSQATRSVAEPVEKARRRSGHSRASIQRREHRQTRIAGRCREQPAALCSASDRPATGLAGARLAAVRPAAEMTPLGQRSLVATHPHLSGAAGVRLDRTIADDPSPATGAAPPRCKSAHPNAFALALSSFARKFQDSEPSRVEGAWPHCRGARRPQSGWRLASLDSELPKPDPSASRIEPDWPIRWRASASCLAAPLRAVLERVADKFGPVTVNSTCRSRKHNARVGGAPRSYHLTGNAVDFRVRGNYRKVHRFLKQLRSVGGHAHYGGGVFHIDTGPRRTWGPGSWRRARG